MDQTDTVETHLHAARALEAAGRALEATDLLRRAAANGNVAALAALGKHLLIHRPDCAGEGLNATSVAAQGGDGESAHILAVFMAEGVIFRQSWQAALGALCHSAALGWAPAQREIAFLAGASTAAHAPATQQWKTLLEGVDFTDWFRVPAAELVSPAPRILFVKDFASPRVCEWLIELACPRLKAAKTFDPESGEARYESGRNNSDCHLVLPHSDLVLALVRARIAALVDLPVSFFEPPTMLHYKPGETFSPHHDFLDDSKGGLSKEIAQNGQRILTFLLYLNDGFEGGETEFPLIGMRYKGKKGDAVFFWNVLPDGSVDRQTLHTGLPPANGEKWLLSQWVRNIPI